MNIEKIYIDMDGVLADFERGVREHCGMGTEDDERMWASVKNVDHFYYKLEPIRGSVEMLKTLIDKYGDKCEILSAVPKARRGIIHAEEDKQNWIREYFGNDIVINLVHDWTEKLPFCTGKGCVLIDDRSENIKGWVDAGGTGILFDNSENAIKQVNEYERLKMSSFDKIIGYSAIKNELIQICDMIKNNEVYESLGAKLPQGILMYGDPGLGKTLMAKCFLEECQLPTYTLRRNKSNDDFVSDITETFKKAKANTPSVVFLDDVDKFANEDYDHRDAEEYVAIQAGIDEVKGEKVFVLATANDRHKLPSSLIRAGRFDRKIYVQTPNKQDAIDIIKHYLSTKKVADDVNMDDLSRMFSYSSCAELETIINEAAITAGSKRKKHIEMEDLVEAILRDQYDSPEDYTKEAGEDALRTALHEAGHAVVAETLVPGSVGLVSIRTQGRNRTGGFMHRCEDFPRRPQHVCTSLGGKAAVELYYAEASASGCQSDLDRAADLLRDAISNSATMGTEMLDISTRQFPETTENYKARNEAVVHAELERLLFKTREILLKNREFLEAVRDELIEKETLLYSDIQRIRSKCTLVEVAI